MRKRMRGCRGQQLGEYAIMIGMVATALIGAQIFISRGVGSRLVQLSEEWLVPPAEPTAVDDEPDDGLVKTTQTILPSKTRLRETGSPQRVTTTRTSSGGGRGTTGFTLVNELSPTNPTNRAAQSQVDAAVRQGQQSSFFGSTPPINPIFDEDAYR